MCAQPAGKLRPSVRVADERSDRRQPNAALPRRDTALEEDSAADPTTNCWRITSFDEPPPVPAVLRADTNQTRTFLGQLLGFGIDHLLRSFVGVRNAHNDHRALLTVNNSPHAPVDRPVILVVVDRRNFWRCSKRV